MIKWRFERKYRVDAVSPRAMEAELMLHPAGFKRQHPDRQINNIYFDTPELVTFQENLAGISERKKYRLRWYGQDVQSISRPRLEVKHKHNALGHKTFADIDEQIDLRDLRGTMTKLQERFKMVGIFVPALINSYLRSYFISSDGRFRMTIDRALQYFPVYGRPEFIRYNLADPTTILELKYDQEHDDDAGSIVDFIPYRQTKSSKYVTGMLMLQQ